MTASGGDWNSCVALLTSEIVAPEVDLRRRISGKRGGIAVESAGVPISRMVESAHGMRRMRIVVPLVVPGRVSNARAGKKYDLVSRDAGLVDVSCRENP